MEIKYTICRTCQKIKQRKENGTFGNSKNKKWIDEKGDLWSGKYCPDCNKERIRIKMSKIPRKKKDLSNYSPGQIEELKQKTRERNRNYIAKRLKEDINFKICHNLRSRLYAAIKRNSKIGSAVKDLGCSIEDLKAHLSILFTKGMTWNNYGEWEIDHIKPLISFDLKNREEFLKACNYSNLQPLWKLDNRSKGKK